MNFDKLIRGSEMLLKGAAILCFGPVIYVAFTLRDGWLCSILDTPGCAIFSVSAFYMIIFFSIPAVLLWSLANYVGRLSGDGKGKTSSEIIQDFGGFILKHAPDAGTKFYDEKKLPYKKERIKEALVAGISHAYKLATQIT